MKLYVFLLFFSLSFYSIKAQECKVLLETINQSYTGNCKKGKAHGKGKASGIDTYEGEFKKGWPDGFGTYSWENGNAFKGQFKKGKKNGLGELTIKRDQKNDSVVKGFWKKDTYLGLYEKSFNKLDKSQNVSAINLFKLQDNIHALRFSIREDQKLIRYPKLNIVIHSGQFQDQLEKGDFVELTNVTFPIKLKAFYKQDFVELEIFQPGLWVIKTDLTFIKGLNTQN